MMRVRLYASFGENPTNEWALRNYSQLNATNFHSFWFVSFSFGLFLLNYWILACIELIESLKRQIKIERFAHSLVTSVCFDCSPSLRLSINLFGLCGTPRIYVTHNNVRFISKASQRQFFEGVISKGEILINFIILLIHTNFNDL